MRLRPYLRPLLLIGSVAAGILAPAHPADASLLSVTCVGANYQHFEPGLTNEPQDGVVMSGRDEATTCIDLTGRGLHSFIGPFSGSGPSSCLELLAGGSGVQYIYWNGHQSPAYTSVWHYTNNYSTVNGNNVGVATGPIVSGPLAGTTLTQTLTVPQTNLLACFTEQGMTDNNGPSTWAFTRL
jgi:hypothetical protein